MACCFKLFFIWPHVYNIKLIIILNILLIILQIVQVVAKGKLTDWL